MSEKLHLGFYLQHPAFLIDFSLDDRRSRCQFALLQSHVGVQFCRQLNIWSLWSDLNWFAIRSFWPPSNPMVYLSFNFLASASLRHKPISANEDINLLLVHHLSLWNLGANCGLVTTECEKCQRFANISCQARVRSFHLWFKNRSDACRNGRYDAMQAINRNTGIVLGKSMMDYAGALEDYTGALAACCQVSIDNLLEGLFEDDEWAIFTMAWPEIEPRASGTSTFQILMVFQNILNTAKVSLVHCPRLKLRSVGTV